MDMAETEFEFAGQSFDTAEERDAFKEKVMEEVGDAKKEAKEGTTKKMQDERRQNLPECVKTLKELHVGLADTTIMSTCLGTTDYETSRGYATAFSREYGEEYAKVAAKIASDKLTKEEGVMLQLDQLKQLLGGTAGPASIGSHIRKSHEPTKSQIESLAGLFDESTDAKNTQDQIRIVTAMRAKLAELKPKDFERISRVEKLRGKITRSKFSDEKLREDTLAKLSGHFGSFKSATNKRQQANALEKILDLKIQADSLGATIPPNVQLLLNNTSLVEEIMEHSDDPRGRDKLKDALGAVAEKVPDHGSLSELGEGMHQAASGLASHSGDTGMAGGGSSGVNISEESNKLMDDMSVSTSPEAIRAREGEEQVASKLMNVKSGVLGADTIGSGTLFEKSMTEVSNRGEFSDWNFGERAGFKQMPVSAQPGEAGFKDIKGLVQGSAAETRGAEFLQERSSREGAFQGILYRPTAGIVGEGHLLSEKAGGSRWFDFPGAEDRKQKLDLGIKKEVAGTERPPLRLLGTSGKLGGGQSTSYMPSQAIQGDVPVPQNQFGSDIQKSQTQADSLTTAGQHGGLASSVRMESLIGSPIGGGPKRKQKDVNVQKLNLFGKLPRF